MMNLQLPNYFMIFRFSLHVIVESLSSIIPLSEISVIKIICVKACVLVVYLLLINLQSLNNLNLNL